MTEKVTVVCMKWGTLYGPHYVNRLYAMTRRHLSIPFEFVCFTDDATGLHQDIRPAAIPEIRIDPPWENHPWKKLALYAADIAGITGQVLFFDLDLLIVDSIDCLFEHPGDYCIIHNWTHPGRIVGNSSVFRFEAGSKTHLLDMFHDKPTQHWIDLYGNEQAYLSHILGREGLTYWPAEWCVSFKRHCLPGGLMNWVRTAQIPQGARVVVFHGHPNPDEAGMGKWPGGFHKHLKPVPWIADHWHEG